SCCTASLNTHTLPVHVALQISGKGKYVQSWMSDQEAMLPVGHQKQVLFANMMSHVFHKNHRISGFQFPEMPKYFFSIDGLTSENFLPPRMVLPRFFQITGIKGFIHRKNFTVLRRAVHEGGGYVPGTGYKVYDHEEKFTIMILEISFRKYRYISTFVNRLFQIVVWIPFWSVIWTTSAPLPLP